VLNAAVVGLGVGEQHARAYVQCPISKLRWVYDRDASRMHEVLTVLGEGEAAEGFAHILNDSKTDVLSIASYDDDHCGQVIAALEARKHVLVEKPMCRSLPELRAIRRAWEQGGRPHLTANLVLRGAPLYQWLRAEIARGALGEVYAFDGDYLYGRLEKITQGWRKDVEGYSVMQGGGVHLIDLMLWLTDQRPARVTATGNRVCSAGSAFRYADYVSATFEYPSGLVGRITANFGCVHRHQHVVRVFGSRATFLYDDQGARFHTTRSPEMSPARITVDPLPPSKGILIPGFLSTIRRGESSLPALRHDFAVVSCCVAADAALVSAQGVNIDYL
jgi:predicted dehydrogenase